MWLEGGVANHVTVISIAGGERDWMVPAHLTQTKTNHSINMAVSKDTRHRAYSWLPLSLLQT